MRDEANPRLVFISSHSPHHILLERAPSPPRAKTVRANQISHRYILSLRERSKSRCNVSFFHLAKIYHPLPDISSFDIFISIQSQSPIRCGRECLNTTAGTSSMTTTRFSFPSSVAESSKESRASGHRRRWHRRGNSTSAALPERGPRQEEKAEGAAQVGPRAGVEV